MSNTFQWEPTPRGIGLRAYVLEDTRDYRQIGVTPSAFQGYGYLISVLDIVAGKVLFVCCLWCGGSIEDCKRIGESYCNAAQQKRAA